MQYNASPSGFVGCHSMHCLATLTIMAWIELPVLVHLLVRISTVAYTLWDDILDTGYNSIQGHISVEKVFWYHVSSIEVTLGLS